MNLTDTLKKYKVWIIFAVFIIFNIIYNSSLPLHADEAYYWVWSNRPAMSYFDHPPMIAYFIKLIRIFGDSEVIIRMIAVISLSVSALLLAHLMKLISKNNKVAETTLLIFMFLPLTQAGIMVVTPDTPLILFWTLFIYSFYRYYLKEENSFAYLMGFAAGAVLLSKYTGILAIFFSLLFVILRRDFKIFKKAETVTAMAITTLVFSPVLIWNAKHEWVSFAFQFSHGVAEKSSVNFGTFIEFFGSQLGVFNPVFFIALLIFIVKYFKEIWKNEELTYITFVTLGTIGLFTFLAFSKKQEANWAAPAYITGTGLLAYFISKYNYRKILTGGIVFTLLAIGILKFPVIKSPASLLYKFNGNDTVFIEAADKIKEGAVVLSDSFQNASLYDYYSKGKNKVYTLDSSRYSNYNMWKDEDYPNLHKVYFVGTKSKVAKLKEEYSNIKLIDDIVYDDQIVKREIVVYYCEK